ncbi:low affinity iron permease family protein [Acidisphaera sp. S103]|uniref:low affinity iron permease family protein n=1 Tax=Acidisphaera sp. S103 TaxID=1747223 RepID=UPI00131D18BE|nr:low affinity iron permease family protein [Acidisphaera sp. S103]
MREIPSVSRQRSVPTSVTARAFSRFSAATARRTGHIAPFVIATLLVMAWAISGPIAHWSDTWQLVMNTISSAVTFLMVFVIQGSQNRDTDIINAKLNEIIRSLPEARQEFLNLDDLSEAQLRALNLAFSRIGKAESQA